MEEEGAPNARGRCAFELVGDGHLAAGQRYMVDRLEDKVRGITLHIQVAGLCTSMRWGWQGFLAWLAFDIWGPTGLRVLSKTQVAYLEGRITDFAEALEAQGLGPAQPVSAATQVRNLFRQLTRQLP